MDGMKGVEVELVTEDGGRGVRFSRTKYNRKARVCLTDASKNDMGWVG
jgi:hypothetical protein